LPATHPPAASKAEGSLRDRTPAAADRGTRGEGTLVENVRRELILLCAEKFHADADPAALQKALGVFHFSADLVAPKAPLGVSDLCRFGAIGVAQNERIPRAVSVIRTTAAGSPGSAVGGPHRCMFDLHAIGSGDEPAAGWSLLQARQLYGRAVVSLFPILAGSDNVVAQP
jgi:hypothetical protein